MLLPRMPLLPPTHTSYPNLHRCCSSIVVALPLLLPCTSPTLYHTYLILARAFRSRSRFVSSTTLSRWQSCDVRALPVYHYHLLLSPPVLARYPLDLSRLSLFAVHYPTVFSAPVDRLPRLWSIGSLRTGRRLLVLLTRMCVGLPSTYGSGTLPSYASLAYLSLGRKSCIKTLVNRQALLAVHIIRSVYHTPEVE